VTDPLILFIATAGPQDISIARREPDGTLRRAEYANVNWLERLSRDKPSVVSLNPDTDLRLFDERMRENLARMTDFSSVLDLTGHVSGYFTAMKRYHGSDWSFDIAGTGTDVYTLSEALGIPVQSYAPDKNSTNRLNWTMRLWERTKN
jgi:hypothetical protein